MAHAHLWRLAFGPGRERYEVVRTAYNLVRPDGFSPVPPFEEWRGMSDICGHAYCRYTAVLVFKAKPIGAFNPNQAVRCMQKLHDHVGLEIQ